MSNKKDYIKVRIQKEQIRAQLKKMLGSEHCELISQIIIDNLSETEVGLAQLYKAFSGLQDQLKYNAGQQVWVDIGTLYSWRVDKDKMYAAGLVHQERVKGTITRISKTSQKPYTISYDCINSNGEEETDTTDVEEHQIFPYDSYPME